VTVQQARALSTTIQKGSARMDLGTPVGYPNFPPPEE
jgi:hypothetical protein